MRQNRRDDGQLSCRKREMKTMNANTALDGHTTVIKMAERGGVPLSAQIDQGDRTEAKSSLVFPTAMVVKVKDAETKRNKASVAHTGWKKRTKTSTTTPKKSACIQVACNNFFNRKFANQRAIVQQENHIHRVTGLVVWRKEG